jgi:hypothetical protein
MAERMTADERAARRMIGDDKAIAIKLAQMQEVGYGKKKTTAEEEDDLYWFKDETVDENMLRMTPNPQTGKPYTEAGIAYMVYPKRRKLIYSGTRALDLQERIKYVAHMAKRHEKMAAESDDEYEDEPAAMAEMGAY